MEKLLSLKYNINNEEDIPYEDYCKFFLSLYLLTKKMKVAYKIIGILFVVAVWIVLNVLFQLFFQPYLPLNDPFTLLYLGIGVIIISFYLWKNIIELTLKGSFRKYKEGCFFETGTSIELNLYDDNLETIIGDREKTFAYPVIRETKNLIFFGDARNNMCIPKKEISQNDLSVLRTIMRERTKYSTIE